MIEAEDFVEQDRDLDQINIQGFVFDLAISRTRPININDNLIYENIRLLVNFLEQYHEKNLLDGSGQAGEIVCADDQVINQQHLKRTFENIGVKKELVLFSNGQEVVEFFQELLNEQFEIRATKVAWPVKLLILDINMPLLNGIETLLYIKELF